MQWRRASVRAGSRPTAAARSATISCPIARWPISRPSSLRPISAPSVNSRVLPTSWSIAAAVSRSESSLRWRLQASCASVATATGVLEQAAQVGVVAGARAGRAAELGAEGGVAQERVDQLPQARVVHLAAEVLEEAVELLQVAVGGGQELGGSASPAVHAGDRGELGGQLVAEALDAPGHPHEVAAVELAGEEVGVAEGAGGDGAAAVAQLDREVGAAGAGGHPVLARAGEHALDGAARAQPGDGDALFGCGRHPSILGGEADATGCSGCTPPVR